MKHIPLIGALFSFRGEVLWKSLRELALLWLFSTLPVIFSSALEAVTNESFTFDKWFSDQIESKIIFVYTTAFLSSVLLLLIDRVVYPKKHRVFSGATLCFFLTVVILVCSAWLYGREELSGSLFFTRMSYIMYFLSLYFWFLSIADAKKEEFGYENEVNESEDVFAKKAAQKRELNDDSE